MATAQYTKLSEYRDNAIRLLGTITSQKLKPAEDDADDAARDALDEVSAVAPQTNVHEEAGDGASRMFDLATTIGSDWVEGSSRVAYIESVTGANTDAEVAAELKSGSTWLVKLNTAGASILWVDSAAMPATGTTLRIYWETPHTLQDLDGATATTVPPRVKQFYLLLGAERLARLVARKACDLADNTTGVDQVDFDQFHRRWTIRANEFRKLATERVNPEDFVTGEGTAVEWQSKSQFGRTRISH